MTDRLKGMTKGWEPPIGKGAHRAKASGWVGQKTGRGDPDKERRERQADHVSRPLNTLVDPNEADSFAPPPKHSAYYGPNASNPTTPTSATASSSVSRPSQQVTNYQQPRPPAPGGWGAVTAPSRQRQIEAEPEPPKPPEPYRQDTTGFSTAGLPKPPVRRNVDTASPPVPPRGPAPPPRQAAASPAQPPRQVPSAARAAPAPPPRLPPRQNEYPDEYTPPPPPAYDDALRDASVDQNQNPATVNAGAASRLGQAGVRVPGFGIGQQSGTTQPANPQLGELQSRFSRMTTGSTSPSTPTTPAQPSQSPMTAGGGTTWAQKQAALKTASSFRNDPSSVSLSDARATASTANNFRERHGAQVASAAGTANSLNNKYGISNRLGGMGQSTASPPPGQTGGVLPPPGPRAAATPPPAAMASAAGKKAAPPPPPKKSTLGGGQEPPPIPTSSKPKPT